MHALLRKSCIPLLLLAAPVDASARPMQQVDVAIGPGQGSDTAVAELPIDSAVTIGTLDNGLRYYVRANAEPARRAELRLVVKAGSLQEDDDQRGLAHFLEHMAFNGTTHFEKQELIDYLESIGMRFGADLNASTTYDHTLYKLTVPTDEPGALETALRILEDWARGITLEPEEIDAERGVVLSEWRARLGAGTRVRTHTDSILLGSSRHHDRHPIGLPESIENAPRDAILRFYEDWYRPELMAVVVVGDVDPGRVQSLIAEHFGDLEAQGDRPERIEYALPTHATALVSVVTDPELTGSTVEVIQKFVPAPVNSVERLRDGIVQSIFTAILNQRLREIATRSGAPFLGARTRFGSYLGGMDVHHVITARVRDGELLEGFRAALTEVERIARHGITAEELDREKRGAESRYARAMITRSKIESDRYAASYANHFITGRTPASVEASVALSRTLLETITEDDVEALARRWKSRANLALIATIPEKEGVRVPTEDELLAVLDEVGRAALAADDADDAGTGSAELMPTLPEPGAVVAETFIPEVGITVWTLANEARVILKPTDFAPDEVLLYAYGWGGTSLLSAEELPDAALAGALPAVSGLGSLSSTELRNAVVGKLLSVGIRLGAYTQSVSGKSTVRDFETFLQLVHNHFTAPRLDEEAIRAWKRRGRAAIEGRAASPAEHFSDTIQAILSQRHPRARRLTPADIDAIDPQRALEIYRERFADPGGFTFVFVGAFEPDSIRPLIERYIGGLPTEPGSRGWRDTGMRPPSGVIEKEFRLGREPRARIAIVFTGPFTHTADEQFALSAMTNVLGTRLRERLREALGGTYSVSVHPEIRMVPEPTYSVQILFDAAPDRAEEMRNAVFDEIERLRESGPTAEEIENVREEYARQLELSIETNPFWVHVITSYDQMERPLAGLAEYGRSFQTRLTAELVQTMIRQYLNPSWHVRVTQLPAM